MIRVHRQVGYSTTHDMILNFFLPVIEKNDEKVEDTEEISQKISRRPLVEPGYTIPVNQVCQGEEQEVDRVVQGLYQLARQGTGLIRVVDDSVRERTTII